MNLPASSKHPKNNPHALSLGTSDSDCRDWMELKRAFSGSTAC